MNTLNTLRTALLVLVLVAGASTTPALTPGPTIILECPGCKKGLREYSVGSGNTIGAKWWTDGKVDVPMMPLRHVLRKCPHCRELFWIADANTLAKFWVPEDKWAKAESLLDPVEEDYLAAAMAKGVTREREFEARKRAWWLANDTVRGRPERTLAWSGARRENLEKLSALINEHKECEIILKAEIARELGQFEACVKLLTRSFTENGCESYAEFVRGLAREKKSSVELRP
jgi:hypothetical protein